MTCEAFFAFFAAAIVLIVIPGPTNMVVVSSALQHGFKRSIWTIVGAAVSHAFFFSIAFAGLATVLLTSAALFEWIRWVGVGYLIWLGIQHWTSRIDPVPGDISDPVVSAGSLFLRGFAVNTTNPKALVFYAAFFPPFVDPHAPVIPQLTLMGVVFVGIFVVVAAVHSFAAARARGLMRNPRYTRLVNWVSGSFLIGAGVLLASVRSK